MPHRFVNYFTQQYENNNSDKSSKEAQSLGDYLDLQDNNGHLCSQENLQTRSNKRAQVKLLDFLSTSLLLVIILQIIQCLSIQTVAARLIQPVQFYNSYNNVGLARRPYQIRRNPRIEIPPDEQSSFQRHQRDAINLEASARQLSGILPSFPGPPPTKRQLREQEVVTQLILPDENYRSAFNSSQQEEQQLRYSYVIDHKRFVEAVPSRCWASTILEDPASVEPSFIIIKPASEVRLNATAPLELIRQLAGFEPQKKTTIFVHGFTQSYPNTTWLRKIRGLFEVNSLVSRHNLIIMDWGVASHGSYSQSAALASGMGSYLANFIMKLIDLGADRMSIHIIGHSLGAHLAGFAGKRIRPRLGRITALDPAGPCFGKLFSNSATDRLSPGDAFEVDVYHYDDDFLGLPGQHGQFDIYVNGGSSQPGCTDNVNTMFQAVITMLFRRNRVLSESHTRSTEVATVRLSSTGCQAVAYECLDYAAFISGECGQCDDNNDQCFFMGFEFQYGELGEHFSALRTSFPSKKFYITTGSAEIYCLNHYQLLIKFEPNSQQLAIARRNKWRLNLELVSDRQEQFNITVTNQMAPNVFSYLLLTEAPPMRIRLAKLQIRASDGTIVALKQQTLGENEPPIRVLGLDINFMSNINPIVRRSLSSRLCPVGWVGESRLNDYNAIPDLPGKADQSSESWLQFDECLSPIAPI